MRTVELEMWNWRKYRNVDDKCFNWWRNMRRKFSKLLRRLQKAGFRSALDMNYETDYETASKRFRITILHHKICTRADFGSDHLPFVSSFIVKLQKLNNVTTISRLLNDPSWKEMYICKNKYKSNEITEGWCVESIYAKTNRNRMRLQRGDVFKVFMQKLI